MCKPIMICIFCDQQMLHCYSCNACYCETENCPSNQQHDYLDCRENEAFMLREMAKMNGAENA
jgi:hypothetical protein